MKERIHMHSLKECGCRSGGSVETTMKKERKKSNRLKMVNWGKSKRRMRDVDTVDGGEEEKQLKNNPERERMRKEGAEMRVSEEKSGFTVVL